MGNKEKPEFKKTTGDDYALVKKTCLNCKHFPFCSHWDNLCPEGSTKCWEERV